MINVVLIVLVVFLGMIGWAIYQSQSKRPSPFTDLSNSMPHPVVVIDVEMPFSSMVLFMVKLALASIPAMVIVTIIGVFVLGALSALGMGYGPLSHL